MKKLIYFISMALMLISCKKDRLRKEKEVLIGKWNWTEAHLKYNTCNLLPFTDTLTPVSENKSFSIEFYKKGVIEMYENNLLKSNYKICFQDFFEDNLFFKGGYCFRIELDCSESNLLTGCVKNDSLVLFQFPIEKEDCRDTHNYFIRE